MDTLDKDWYQSVEFNSDSQDKYNDINLHAANFLPFFDIRFIKDFDKTKYDVFDD